MVLMMSVCLWCLSTHSGPPLAASLAPKAPLLQSLLQPPPFPLALDDPGSILAVKGPLRRFAPWTAPGRSERRAAYEGKGGGRAVGCGGRVASPLAHDKGYYHSYTEGANAPKGTFRPYQLSEPQPRGAVTRRAVAQRKEVFPGGGRGAGLLVGRGELFSSLRLRCSRPADATNTH